jgi:hypothetical protein
MQATRGQRYLGAAAYVEKGNRTHGHDGADRPALVD